MRASYWFVGVAAVLAVSSAAACKVTVEDSTGGAGSTSSSTSKASSSSTTTATTTSNGSTSVASTGSMGTGGAPAGCNPVIGTECPPTEACDYSGEADPEFICYPGDNTGTLCGACDPVADTYCGDGLSCVATDFTNPDATEFKCYRFCCTDADCGGAAGSCNLTLGDQAAVGVCGTIDQATMMAAPVCNTPATPPSNGACVP